MKFFIDLSTRRFVKGPASGIPLDRTFLKRRDKVEIEIVFVEKSSIVATPSGTTFSTGLKTAFADTEFLAISDATGLLDLYTTAIEELFASDPASVSALLEVKTSRPGEETRTSTLGVDIENSVILGDEGSPAADVSLKATSADAIAGTSNEKWMTPLRVSEAIAALGGGSGGTAVNWSTLTGKPSTFPPSSHTHPISEVAGLQTALNSKQPAGTYAAATHTHDASSITSGTLSIDRIPVLPSQAPVVVNGLLASIPSSQESSIVTGTVVITSDGKRYVYKGTGSKTSADSYIILADIAPSWASISEKPAAFSPEAHTHLVSEVAGLQGALDAKQPAGSYASAAQGAKADTASQPGHIHARADITGLDSALATKITGSGVADMQVVTALPASPSPTTFYIVIPSGATTASAVTLGSVSLLTGSGSGGGSTFTPSSISGLQLWLDASDTATLFDATSGGSAVTADAAAVARWQDKSSNAYEAIQTTANQRPILKQSVQNSKSILRFDGANDCLQIPSIELNTNITMFVVGKFFSTNPLWLEHDYGFYLSGASLGWLFRRLASVQAAGLPENWFAVSAAISSITYNGTAAQVRKNGTLLANSAISGTAPTNLLYSAPLNIGSRGQTQLFSKGDFCEYLIYDGILSDQNRAQVESYLSTKWGIAL